MGDARSGAHSPDCRAGACAQTLAGGGAIGRVLSAQAVKSTAPCVPLRPKHAALRWGAGPLETLSPPTISKSFALLKSSPGVRSLRQSDQRRLKSFLSLLGTAKSRTAGAATKPMCCAPRRPPAYAAH